MAWIEVHQGLPRHPKTIKLATALKVPSSQAVGHLVTLWLWASDYAVTGNLEAYSSDEIANGANYKGNPDKFVSALKECGWVDVSGYIHDWYEYFGKLLDRKEKNKLRMRETRAVHVQDTCIAQVAHVQKQGVDTCGATLPNQPNQPNQTNPIHSGVCTVTESNTPVFEECKKQPSSIREWPSLKDVLYYAEVIGIPAWRAEAWFDKMNSSGWMIKQGVEVKNWQFSLKVEKGYWIKDGMPAQQNQKVNGDGKKQGGHSGKYDSHEYIEPKIINIH